MPIIIKDIYKSKSSLYMSSSKCIYKAYINLFKGQEENFAKVKELNNYDPQMYIVYVNVTGLLELFPDTHRVDHDTLILLLFSQTH